MEIYVKSVVIDAMTIIILFMYQNIWYGFLN